MPRNHLLSKLGLFVRPAFLQAAECRRLERLMTTGPSEPATVYLTADETGVDERVRRTLGVDPPARTQAKVERALCRLRSDLGRHFGTELTGCEPPQYLVYGPGAFFAPHRDRPTPRAELREAGDRQISSVVFLNAPRSGDGAGYEGGQLTFYGLVDAAAWKDVGLGCEQEPGLLIAFRADTLHEVTPVTAGRRCTIVSWFS